MEVKTDVTNPAGVCFVSYRRSRVAEVTALVRGLRERGVPTWQDINDLDESHTNSELRRVLKDSNTACSVLWITPDVADSDIIRRIEAPLIMDRADSVDDPFFAIPVAAGGAGYDAAARAVGEDLSLPAVEEWNIKKISNDPARESDVRAVANRVLSRRLRAIIAAAKKDTPLRLGLFARKGPPSGNQFALAMDWTGRITNRHASKTIWKRHLLPAIDSVVDAIEQEGGGKRVIASGLPTISAAFALGRGFMAPRGIESEWMQFSPASGEASWNLREKRENTELAVRCRDKNASAEDLAVLISISAPVEHAWAASKDALPSFRAIVEVRHDSQKAVVLNPSQALDIAHQTIEAVRNARNEFRPKGKVHLFMAAPVGLAFLLGQLSNTLGPVRLYEHDEVDAVGRFLPGALLGAST